ncbi:MAG: SDR family NAD(P)-dependent oxidoreductase, partial [Alphaproteobacteria bacterium]
MLLRKGAKIALIGATGGIGRAMLEYLSQNHNVSKIYALSRNPALSSLDKVQTLKLDFQDEDTVKNAANVIKADGGNLDLVFVATGLLHADGIKPEKSLKELDASIL